MYRRMLVPLDGSELAEVVFTYAKELAGRLDIDIILLHVSGPHLEQFAPMSRAYIERAAETLGVQAREVQENTGIPPGGKPLEARGEVTVGYPADEILRLADEYAVDLILMATHGRSGKKRWHIGNVADKVLRASKVPIWLVRAGVPDEPSYDKWPSTTIIVPLDTSEVAESVLPHVEALAKQRSTKPVEVTLLRVCEPPTLPSYSIPELPTEPLNWGEYMQQETARCKQGAQEYLAGVEKQLKESNIEARSEVLLGKAADEIVDFANKNPFNLVVMATHGRSGLSRWVYGSVAENVLVGVSSSVFLVRPH
jgi:nucleotide-binding universal stress UspA family protein